MPQEPAGRVLGREGLKGTLLDPLPATGGGDQPVRVEFDTGQRLEIPSSMLRRRSPDTFEIPLGPADLDQRSARATSDSDETVVPVLAEELQVGTRAVPTGGVRVHRRVYEHDEAVDVPL
jgi:hypothetical protein